jgi:superfamily II DNA or RNA helicase
MYGIKSSPYKHQLHLAESSLSRKRIIYSCEVGTGKSLAAILTINSIRKKTLIVCPNNILKKWSNEITKHSNLTSTMLTGTVANRKKCMASTNNVHIVNYEILAKLKDSMTYDVVIFDESHRLKNPSSKQSKAAADISSRAEYVIGMTGTFYANNYIDIFGQLKVIDKRLFGTNKYHFINRYCLLGYFKNVVGYRKIDELKAIIESSVISYRLSDIVDIPDVIDDIIPIDIPSETMKHIASIAKTGITTVNDHEIVADRAITKDLRINQLCSGFIGDKTDSLDDNDNIVTNRVAFDVDTNKLDVLFDIINNYDGKIVVWCRFIHSINRIMKVADKEKIGYDCYYSGNHGDYLNFESSDKKLWIGQLQTGIGYDLPSVVLSVYYELDHSRINLIQTKGRTRRVVGGTDEPRVYKYLLTDYEQNIYKSLQYKNLTAKDVEDHVREYTKNLH